MKSPGAECAMTAWAVLITPKVEEKIADGVANKNCGSPAIECVVVLPIIIDSTRTAFSKQKYSPPHILRIWTSMNTFVQPKSMATNEIRIAVDAWHGWAVISQLA
jgi:hypothetical protein